MIQQYSLHTNRRKKIWNVYDGYHCSIIGTCLTMSDLTKLTRKVSVGFEKNISSYKLHSTFVSMVSGPSVDSKKIHKSLDRKYKIIIKKFSRAKTDRDIEELWNEALATGSLAGAYWAIMTHNCVSEELIRKVYGFVHMLSHDSVSLNSRLKKQIGDRQKKIIILNQELARKQKIFKKKVTERDVEIQNLKDKRSLMSTMTGPYDSIQEKTKKVHFENRTEEHERALWGLPYKPRNDGAAIQELEKQDEIKQKEIDELSHLLKTAQSLIGELEKENRAMKHASREKDQELAVLEQKVMATLGVGCAGCDDKESSRCPGPALCGKTILYVGGMHKMVPHYKKLIEKSGGSFLHHDGGREASSKRLPGMLCQADAVFCPVDCISHHACLCVKKLCKQYQKPYVMMRSSGLSSLAKGLEELES